MKERKSYDPAKKTNAGTRFIMRVLVAAYILYMAVKILLNTFSGLSAMPLSVSWIFCVLFALLGAFFVVYALRRLRDDLKAAVIVPESGVQDATGDGQE